ncbi:hypothetical protein GCM10028801_36060 [Nocardioides maradonensis]
MSEHRAQWTETIFEVVFAERVRARPAGGIHGLKAIQEAQRRAEALLRDLEGNEARP